MKFKVLSHTVGFKCWFRHKWIVRKDTGFIKYSECKKCTMRKIEQESDSVYQPVDLDFLNKDFEGWAE